MRRLRTFFDHFLKGIDNEVKNWPKVRSRCARKTASANFAPRTEWPLARTQYTKLYLNAADGTLQNEPVTRRRVGLLRSGLPRLGEADRASSISRSTATPSSPAT